MIENVFLLASCRNLKLLPATLFVFDTLRIGFPNTNVKVYLNQMDEEAKLAVLSKCRHVGAKVINFETTHWEWIERMVEWEDDPFAICDTDVIFWDKVEHWEFDAPLAGLYMPEFIDEFTNAITKPRLHTSLMFIKPEELRSDIELYYRSIPDTWFTRRPNLFETLFVPDKVNHLPVLGDSRFPIGRWSTRNFFYDTCSMLYHAVKSASFGESHLECYDHLHCGCSADLIAPHVTDGKMLERHEMIFKNPELAKGIWRQQRDYFYGRATHSNDTDTRVCATL